MLYKYSFHQVEFSFVGETISSGLFWMAKVKTLSYFSSSEIKVNVFDQNGRHYNYL